MLEVNNENMDVNDDVNTSKIPWRIYNELPGTYFGSNILTLFRDILPSELTKNYSLVQRAAISAARTAVSKFLLSNIKKKNSRKSLAKDGRKPRYRHPMSLFKN